MAICQQVLKWIFPSNFFWLCCVKGIVTDSVISFCRCIWEENQGGALRTAEQWEWCVGMIVWASWCDISVQYETEIRVHVYLYSLDPTVPSSLDPHGRALAAPRSLCITKCDVKLALGLLAGLWDRACLQLASAAESVPLPQTKGLLDRQQHLTPPVISTAHIWALQTGRWALRSDWPRLWELVCFISQTQIVRVMEGKKKSNLSSATRHCFHIWKQTSLYAILWGWITKHCFSKAVSREDVPFHYIYHMIMCVLDEMHV